MNSRYRQIEVLKQTMATRTIHAFDEGRGQDVILKEVRLDAAQVWVSAFKREVEVLKALDSPWMPDLLEEGCQSGSLYLCESWMEGTALDVWMASRPSRKEKREIFMQIIGLIQAVHRAGYLYLDLKPENILLHHGHACLIDFNACLPIGSTRPILVNKDSLPPEGADGHAMKESADQIGLGRLYLRMFGPSRIAWTALSRQPERRYRSLAAMEKAVSRSSRNRLLSLMAALLAALGALLPFASQAMRQPEKKTEDTSLLLLEEAKLPDAAELCQQFSRLDPQPAYLDATLWLQASKAALRESHIGLAGYLQAHQPVSDDFSIRFSRLMLSLLLGQEVKQEELMDLLDALPEQNSWSEPLSLLMHLLCEEPQALSCSRLEGLLARLDDLESMDEDCARAICALLLERTSRELELPTLSEAMQACLQDKAPDEFALYLQAREVKPSHGRESSEEKTV